MPTEKESSYEKTLRHMATRRDEVPGDVYRHMARHVLEEFDVPIAYIHGVGPSKRSRSGKRSVGCS